MPKIGSKDNKNDRPSRKKSKPTGLKDYQYEIETKVHDKWFSVHCLSNNRRYVVNSKKLDTIGGEPFDPELASIGDHALWNINGRAYEVEIKDEAMKKELLTAPNVSATEKKKYEEDSDNSVCEYDEAPKSKMKKTNQESDHEDSFVNPVLNAEDGSFVGQSTLQSTKDSGLIQEEIDVIKEDVSYLRGKMDQMSQTIDKLYHLVKRQKTKEYLESPSRGHQTAHSHFKSVMDTPSRKSYTTTNIESPCSSQICESIIEAPFKEESESTAEDKFIYNNTNLLHVHGKDFYKYALALMDILFSKEEMASSCFYATGRSKKEALPQNKVHLLEECVDMKYGKGTISKYKEGFKSRLNQKCIDQRKGLVTKPSEKADNQDCIVKKTEDEHSTPL